MTCHWPRASVFDFPLRTRTQRSAPRRIGIEDRLARTDDLAAAGKIRSLDDVHQRLRRSSSDAGSSAPPLPRLRACCAAAARTPCRPRRRRRRSAAASAGARAAARALAAARRSSAGNRPCPDRFRRAADRRSASAALRCIDTPRPSRRPACRSCPGRRSADSAAKNPAPCAPARRRSTRRRAGGICRALRRRCAPTSCAARPSAGPARASHRGCGAAPASARPRRSESRGRAPRSSHR